MASPQLEHGFIQLANEVIEALARYPFHGRQRAIIDVIIRKTWGEPERDSSGNFKRNDAGIVTKKRSAWIALSVFAQATGLHQRHVCAILKDLISANVISKSSDQQSGQPHYSFQKDYDQWLIPARAEKPAKVFHPDTPAGGTPPHTGDTPIEGNTPLPPEGIDIPTHGNSLLPHVGDIKQVSNKVTNSKRGSPLTHTVSVSRSTRPSDHQEAIAFWCTEYETALHHRYRFAGPSEGAMIKSLLRQFGLDTLKEMMSTLIHTDDDFVREKRGITIKTLKNDAMLLAQKVEGTGHGTTKRQSNAAVATANKYTNIGLG